MTWARVYATGQGRWLSPDPLAGDISNPQSLNRYAYALNNPCSLKDPLGLDACNFNIGIINEANLSGEDVTLIQNQIAAIFQASSKGQPDSVGVNFQFSGTPPRTR